MPRILIGILGGVCSALAACSDADPRSTQPTHLTHAMVGTYDVLASYSSHKTIGGTSAVNATLTGTIVVGDTVEYHPEDGRYSFPDVRMTAVFCSAPGSCTPAESWSSYTSLFPNNGVVTFGGGNIHFEAPFLNGGFSGFALYSVNADSRNTYTGTFSAARK